MGQSPAPKSVVAAVLKGSPVMILTCKWILVERLHFFSLLRSPFCILSYLSTEYQAQTPIGSQITHVNSLLLRMIFPLSRQPTMKLSPHHSEYQRVCSHLLSLRTAAIIQHRSYFIELLCEGLFPVVLMFLKI